MLEFLVSLHPLWLKDVPSAIATQGAPGAYREVDAEAAAKLMREGGAR